MKLGKKRSLVCQITKWKSDGFKGQKRGMGEFPSFLSFFFSFIDSREEKRERKRRREIPSATQACALTKN